MASSKAVNVPTDPRIKEKDVNNKLQLYGIYSGTLIVYSIARGRATMRHKTLGRPDAQSATVLTRFHSICARQGSLSKFPSLNRSHIEPPPLTFPRTSKLMWR